MGDPRATGFWEGLSKRVALSVGGAIGLFLAIRYGGALSPDAAEWVDDVAWVLFSGAAAWRCLRAAAESSIPRHRIGWALQAAGAGAWFTGMLFLVSGQIREPSFASYPTPANWLFLALAPLFAAGIFYLRSSGTAVRIDAKRLADLGLIACSVVAISVMILLHPLMETGRTAQGLLFSVLDPAAFVTATIFTCALFWLDDLDGLGAAAVLLVGAIAVHMVADLVYFRSILVQAGAPFPLEATWLLAFGLQIVAADAYGRLDRSVEDLVESTEPRRPRRGLLEAALPAPLLVGMALMGLLLRDQLTGPVLTILGPILLLFALLMGFREWWVDRSEDRAYRRLEASMDLTRQILAASPASVFTLDPPDSGQPTFLTGRPGQTAGEGVTVEEWTSRLHPEDRATFRAHASAAAEEGERSFDCRLASEPGSYRWVNVRLAPYRPAEGAETLVVGSLVDVDDTKRLEARLLRGQRMEALGRLSGGVAHDFNNLLTTILGYAELGRMEPDLSSSTRESFDAVKEAAERARELTAQLLAFSRRQELRMETIDLHALVREMTDMLSRTLGEDVSIDVVAPDGPVPVRADSTQMEQVLLNLVVNARDAMPNGGALRIGVEEVLVDGHLAGGERVPPGRYALLAVADTGVGMPESVRERVFEPFFTTKEKGRGTGLGLATLHGVVKQHAGYVDVASREGHGSTFRIFLPSAEGPVTDGRPATPPLAILTGSETILVVDDEPSIPRLIRDALAPAGYTVLTANAAEDAVRHFEDGDVEIDLLVTDLVMPGMRGGELARRLQAMKPGLKVVFMSGYADDSNLLEEVTDGTVPFVSKPVSLGRLAEVVRATLDEDDGLETSSVSA